MNLDLQRRPPPAATASGTTRRAPGPDPRPRTDMPPGGSAPPDWDTARGDGRRFNAVAIMALLAVVAGLGLVSRDASTFAPVDTERVVIERSSEPLVLADVEPSPRSDAEDGTPLVRLPWGRLPDAPFEAVVGSPILPLRWSLVTAGAQDGRLVLAEADLRGISGSGSIEQRFGRMWSVLPPSPLSARSEPFVALVDERRVLVWGGREGPLRPSTPLHDGAVVDLDTGEWTLLPPMPEPFEWVRAAGWVGGQLLVTGRQVGGGPALVRWKAGADAWEVLPAPPVEDIIDVAAVTTRGMFVAYGISQIDGNQRADVFLLGFDPATDSWRTYSVSPLRRIHTAVAVTFGDSVVIWGRPSTSSLRSVPAGLVLDASTGVWKQMRPPPLDTEDGLPTAAAAPIDLSGAWAEDVAIFAGGAGTTMLAYSPASGRWLAVTPPPDTPGGRLAWAARRLFRWGGDVGGEPVPQLWMLPARTDTRGGPPRERPRTTVSGGVPTGT